MYVPDLGPLVWLAYLGFVLCVFGGLDKRLGFLGSTGLAASGGRSYSI